jgi:hypothetical protein
MKTVFAAGLLLVGVGAGWAVAHWQGATVAAKPPPVVASKNVPTSIRKPAPAPDATPALMPAGAPRTACPTQAIVGAGAAGDGHVRLQTSLQGKTTADVAALILGGKEAAAASRRRDAEVDFLMACDAADRLARPDPMAAAEARYQLGRHYANVALAGRGTDRATLLRRADQLYSDSLQAFRARYGEAHEKTRFAAAGLAGVRQTLAAVGSPEPEAPRVTPSVPVAAAPRPAPVARAEVLPAAESTAVRRPPAAPRQVDVPQAELPLRQATGQPTAAPLQVRPSFDCNKARSASERTICADPELARMDRELGRLHARARNFAPDPAAFRRQNEEEWRRRESTCRDDRQCLLRWYAHRRDQLQQDVDESGQ